MTDDLLTRVRAADPAAGDAFDPAGVDAALARLLAAEPIAPPPPARRAVRPSVLALAAATAVACVSALVVALPGGGGGAGVPAASAATVLRDARAAAALLPGAGPWTVVVTRDWRSEPPRVVPYTVEQWAADDGVRMTRVTRGDDGRTEPHDGLLVRDAVGSPPGSPSVAAVHAWPTDPDALEARLARGGDANMVHHAAGLLVSPLVTAEQRAALYTILLRQPGARLERGVVDPDGRGGDAVRFVSVDPRPGTDHVNLTYDTTLLFDRESHALLGIREQDDGRTSWTVVLAARRAERAPAPDLDRHYADPSAPPTYTPAG
jgi:hypothetical protein